MRVELPPCLNLEPYIRTVQTIGDKPQFTIAIKRLPLSLPEDIQGK
jgi:hypothetical protein